MASVTFYCIRVLGDGRHQVGTTTDGRDFLAIPRAAFGSPRDAIRYADMRQAHISPLRSPEDGRGDPSPSLPSSGVLTGTDPDALVR